MNEENCDTEFKSSGWVKANPYLRTKPPFVFTLTAQRKKRKKRDWPFSILPSHLSTPLESWPCGQQKSFLLTCISGTSLSLLSAAGRFVEASCFSSSLQCNMGLLGLWPFTFTSNFVRFSNLSILVNLEEWINSFFQIVQSDSVLCAKLVIAKGSCLPKHLEILTILRYAEGGVLRNFRIRKPKSYCMLDCAIAWHSNIAH